MKYELLLSAIAGGDRQSEKLVPDAWDTLLYSVGRPKRMGPLSAWANQSLWEVDLAPSCVRQILLHPDIARKRASAAKNDLEMQKIVDADQAAREHFSLKMTMKQVQEMMAADETRNRRTREIVAEGKRKTSDDFANAALVMQHSSKFSGFQLAHELAVCATLLGDRKVGRWLVAATYDRMLNSIGFDQRFATQYIEIGFAPVDERGICDNERLALGCPTLDSARKRKMG